MMCLLEKWPRPQPCTWHHPRSSQSLASGRGPCWVVPHGLQSCAAPTSRQRIPASPAPPPALGPPSPLPRWPSLGLNLLLILAVGTRPPPLLPSRAEQLRPWLGPGSRLLSPPPTSGTAPPPLQQPGGGGSPGAPAPPAQGPSREAGRPAPPGPPWVSAGGRRRVGPPLAEAPGAGATPVNAPGLAGGLANIPAAVLGPGRARGCSHFWACAGAARGLCYLGIADPAGRVSD